MRVALGLLSENVDLFASPAVAVGACPGPQHAPTTQAAVNGWAGTWTVAAPAAILFDNHLAVTFLAESLTGGHFFLLVVVVVFAGAALLVR